MTAKECSKSNAIIFLKSYRKTLEKIDEAKLMKKAAFALATSCGSVSNNETHSSNISDKVGNGVIEIEKWDAVIVELGTKAKMISAEIKSISEELDSTLSRIIIMNYINLYSIPIMADKSGYSTRHVRRLLKKAEEEFASAYIVKKSEKT